MSVYIPDLYNQLPLDICHQIIKFVGPPSTAKLLEAKCNNYKHYTSRYKDYLQKVICKKGFYSYVMFKHNKYLTRKQHYDLIFANWLYENPLEKDKMFISYYHKESILSIVNAEDAGVGNAMADFIGSDTHKFIICFLFCIYINNFIYKPSYTNFDFKIIDLMRMYEENQSFIEVQFEFFRNFNCEKINKQEFIYYIEDFYDDNASDTSDDSFDNPDFP